MANCPKCGNALADDRARFCGTCGHELAEAGAKAEFAESVQMALPPVGSSVAADVSVDAPGAVPHGQPEGISTYMANLKRAIADGKLSLADAEALKQLAKMLNITDSQERELMQEAREAQRPVQVDDLEDDTDKRTSHGLALYLNTNQFFVQGYSSVIEVKVENLSDFDFDMVKVEVAGPVLPRCESVSVRLKPCEDRRRRIQVLPDFAGIAIVQFRVSCQRGDSIYAYFAEAELPIFEKPEKLQDISIQADKFIEIGGASDSAKNMGNSAKVVVENLVKQEKNPSVNDFIAEYRKQPPAFSVVPLEFDPDRSEQLTNSITRVRPGKTIIQGDCGSLTDIATLQIQSQDRPHNILLIAKPVVTMGRGKKNDIVTRILPRSEANDSRSRKISTEAHCRLELTEKGVYLRDDHSANNTTLEGKIVDANGSQLPGGLQELALAQVLTFKVRVAAKKPDATVTAAYEELFAKPLGNMWQTAVAAKMNALILQRMSNLGPDDANGTESYILLYSLARLGCDRLCALCFPDKGLEPRHAAILYLNDRFYLENLTDLSDVVVNRRSLSKGELIPLSFGDRIRIARIEMQFVQRAQMFVDVPGSS